MANPESAPHLSGERCLAAVMFTDVANFSGEVGRNEDRALAAIERDFQLMSEIIARHRGVLLKKMGDALLAYFKSTVNAVDSALEIQRALGANDRLASGELLFKHRIGIHVGDILVTENDVAGNGVNIAARLQTRAQPGGICISQTVLDVVKHQLLLHVNYLGPQELKNISESVPAYQVLEQNMAPAAPVPANPPAKPEQKPRLTGAFTFGAGAAASRPAPASREKTGPGWLVLMGDFTGRASRGDAPNAIAARPLRVDCDNFEQVFAQLGVALRLPACNQPDGQIELRFKSLEDFHPDQLLQNVPSLAKLLSVRKALLNPSTAAAAANELPGLVSAPQPDAESDDDALARLLGKAPARSTVVKDDATPRGTVQSYIKSITSGSSVPVRGAKENAALASVEMELTAQLRAILHHPDYQALEAGWSGVDFLVREFGGEEDLRIGLVDISKEELAVALAADAQLESGALAGILGAQSCVAVLGNYFFGGNCEDVQLLGRVAKLAAAVGVPFIAGARPELAGWNSFGRQPDPAERQVVLAPEVREAWEKLRKSPEAPLLALALPRVLQRQPYGKSSEPIETFPFTELPASRPHESFLWGNPIFACGHLLARGFVEEGWDVTPHGGEVGGLPVFCFEVDGESEAQPCAEAWLTERSAAVIQGQGLMPVMSIKGRDAVLVPYLRSIAQPAKALSIATR
jgi:type VI secretion system protein ImpC